VIERPSHVSGQATGLTAKLGNGRGLELGAPSTPAHGVDRPRGVRIRSAGSPWSSTSRPIPDGWIRARPVGHEPGDEG
jgi:hypothetical protein